MTDMELAEEIGGLIFDAIKHGDEKHQAWLHDKSHELAPQIIAALRRGHELRQKMRDIFKQYGIGDGSPGWIEHTDQDGKLRRDMMSFEGELIFAIEALLERPPSGEMVMVPMAVVEALSDLTELKKIKRLIEKGEATDEQCRYYEGRKEYSWRFAEQAIENARAMLSTEASKEAK